MSGRLNMSKAGRAVLAAGDGRFSFDAKLALANFYAKDHARTVSPIAALEQVTRLTDAIQNLKAVYRKARN